MTATRLQMARTTLISCVMMTMVTPSVWLISRSRPRTALVVKLSSHLGLDLVDDQLNELSTQWLKDIRSYVVERQDEMLSVDIEPGSELAERLFS